MRQIKKKSASKAPFPRLPAGMSFRIDDARDALFRLVDDVAMSEIFRFPVQQAVDRIHYVGVDQPVLVGCVLQIAGGVAGSRIDCGGQCVRLGQFSIRLGLLFYTPVLRAFEQYLKRIKENQMVIAFWAPEGLVNNEIIRTLPRLDKPRPMAELNRLLGVRA